MRLPPLAKGGQAMIIYKTPYLGKAADEVLIEQLDLKKNGIIDEMNKAAEMDNGHQDGESQVSYFWYKEQALNHAENLILEHGAGIFHVDTPAAYKKSLSSYGNISEISRDHQLIIRRRAWAGPKYNPCGPGAFTFYPHDPYYTYGT